MVSLRLKELFPHETIRQGQEKLVDDLSLAFKEQKILIANAPTGLGKTASALTVALNDAMENKKKIFFLTNRHTQHQIAVDTLKKIKKKTGEQISCVDLIGKRWMCNQEIAGVFGNDFNEYCKSIVEKGECDFYNNVKSSKGLTVPAKAIVKDLERDKPLHNEELINIGKEKSMCSYELALAMAKNALVFIGDYNYIFNPFVMSNLLNKLEIELEDIILIVDEGHNLPSRIMDMMSNNLTSNMIKNGIMEAKKFGYSGVIYWLQELMSVLNNLILTKNSKEALVVKEDFIKKVNLFVDYDEFLNELDMAADEIRKKQRKSYLGGIASFLEVWKGDDEGFTRIISEQRTKHGQIMVLSYTCLDSSLVSKDIFARIYAGVIMSGTLNPTTMYKDLLGIKRSVEEEYNSPFPVENKLSLIIPDTSTKYNLRGEEMFRKIAGMCSEVCNLVPGNVALFFPSYDLRDKICYFFESSKKLFWEKNGMSKEEKEEFLNNFKRERLKGGVLLGVTGANFAEGVDFPGDLLKAVIVIGVPLAMPDLKTKEIMKYYDHKYGRGWDYGYIYPALNKCLQSAGRCIRSETDKGAVIYLDERFAWKNYYDCFPSEGLIVSKEYKKLLEDFF